MNYNFSIFARLVFLTIMSFAHPAVSGPKCPSTNSDTEGYFTTQLRSEGSGDSEGTLQVYYRLLAPLDLKKPTVVVLNGGPGGDFRIINRFVGLKEKANIVSFDHRGVGCTRVLSREALTPFEGGIYSPFRAADDLDALRKNLLGDDGKWYVYGFSYGGALALTYATKYQNNLLGMILDSPATGAKLIKPAKDVWFQKFIYNDPGMRSYFDGIVNRFPSKKEDLLRSLFTFSYSTSGWNQAAKLLQSVMEEKDDEKAKNLISKQLPTIYSEMTIRIWCEEMYDYHSHPADSFFWPEDSFMCELYRPIAIPWETKLSLSSIRTPTLILGGGLDPVITPETLTELQQTLPNVIRYENPKSHHGFVIERPECLGQAIIGGLALGFSSPQLIPVLNSSICTSAPTILQMIDSTYLLPDRL